jgi:tripartite-type tricarboxylate transporter receptor subunit TctC
MAFGSNAWRKAAVVAGVVGAMVAPQVAVAQSPEEFYSGQLITILIGHPPGGSFDAYAQLAAAHMSKHVPGNPTVVVQSMPGGGGNVAAAYFANRAPRDGTMIALLPESLATLQLLDPDISRWDLNDMRYIGSFADVTSVMAARAEAPAKTLDEMKQTVSNVSCSGRTTSSAQAGAIFAHFTGAQYNMVCGYDSATASVLAVFRGEADMTTTVWTSWNSNYKAEIDSGAVTPVIQFGLTRLPELPDVPTAIELVDDQAQKDALAFFAAGGDIGRALLAPPEMPDDRFEALSTAFDALVQDPEFLADAQTRQLPIAPKNAAQMADVLSKILGASPDVIALLDEAREAGFN